MHEAKQEANHVRSELAAIRNSLEQDLHNTEQQVLISFKDLRSRLFEFSRCENNTHLMLVKKEVTGYR